MSAAKAKKLTITAAKSFQKFRPMPPEQLVKRIVSFLGEKLTTPYETAVDVGCSSGRSTEALAPYFKNVIGFHRAEISEDDANSNRNEQLANGLHNVIHRNGSPYKIDCFGSSVQLVTASQCAHWFNLQKFYDETRRVLAPGGVLSIYGYCLPKSSESDVNLIIEKLMMKKLANYMPDQSKLIYVERYTSPQFQNFGFNQEPIRRDEDMWVKINGSVADLVEYIRNTSTVYNFMKKHGTEETDKLMVEFQNELMEALGSSENPENTPLDIEFNFILLTGRKPF